MTCNYVPNYIFRGCIHNWGTKNEWLIFKRLQMTTLDFYLSYYRNPSLGLATKTRAHKGAGQKWSPGVTFHAPRSVGECEGMNFTLPSEFPLWELDFRWTFNSLEGDCKGQNSLDWRVIYIMGKPWKYMFIKWTWWKIKLCKNFKGKKILFLNHLTKKLCSIGSKCLA